MLRKIVAPVITTVLICATLIGYTVASLLFLVDISLWLAIAGVLVLLGFLALMIFVLVERIREIQSGEEDDLDNY